MQGVCCVCGTSVTCVCLAPMCDCVWCVCVHMCVHVCVLIHTHAHRCATPSYTFGRPGSPLPAWKPFPRLSQLKDGWETSLLPSDQLTPGPQPQTPLASLHMGSSPEAPRARFPSRVCTHRCGRPPSICLMAPLELRWVGTGDRGAFPPCSPAAPSIASAWPGLAPQPPIAGGQARGKRRAGALAASGAGE